MGTRSLTFVYDGKTPVVCMYRQFDGYPSGHGQELAEFLFDGKLVNGIPLGSNEKLFNGMGCLAAQMVAAFKESAGGFYLFSTDLDQDSWQEYEYHVFEDKVIVYSRYSKENNVLFNGSWTDFAEFCSEDYVS
jgi:hypothetical protein